MTVTPVLVRWLLAFACASGVWLYSVPERFFPPGTFDYVGNSHNLMHVMVLIVWRELHHGVRALVEADAASQAW